MSDSEAKPDPVAKAQAVYDGFIDNFQSIVLGTVNAEGKSLASYAPYVKDANNNFYVFVSGLSEHTANLESSDKASVLFLEDEKEADQIFARKRLTFDCAVQLISREADNWEALADLFSERFGKMAIFFKKSPDFRLIQLAPKNGTFVIGFGAAFKVTGDKLDTLTHMGGDSGHGHGGHGHAHGGGHGAAHGHAHAHGN